MGAVVSECCCAHAPTCNSACNTTQIVRFTSDCTVCFGRLCIQQPVSFVEQQHRSTFQFSSAINRSHCYCSVSKPQPPPSADCNQSPHTSQRPPASNSTTASNNSDAEVEMAPDCLDLSCLPPPPPVPKPGKWQQGDPSATGPLQRSVCIRDL